MKASEIPDDRRRLSKTNIEEQLRIARLNQAVASVESQEMFDEKWMDEKPHRKGKSMVHTQVKYMVHAGVNTSVRIFFEMVSNRF